MLSKEQRKTCIEYLGENCPYCGTDQIEEVGTVEEIGLLLKITKVCKKCGKGYKLVYPLRYIEELAVAPLPDGVMEVVG